jgi:hypothetical protein
MGDGNVPYCLWASLPHRFGISPDPSDPLRGVRLQLRRPGENPKVAPARRRQRGKAGEATGRAREPAARE